MKGNFYNRRRDHGNNNGNASGAPGTSTGNGRSGGPSTGSGSSTFYESGEVSRGFNDRLDHLLVNSIGSEAIATVTSGAKYSGILVATNLESSNGIDIVLKYPKVIDAVLTDSIEKLSEQLEDTLLINGEEVAELELKNIDFTLDEKWENSKRQENEERQRKEKETEFQEENGKNAFKTDTDISRSGKHEVREHELLKWTPDEDDENLNETLEDNAGEWDQFSVNEQKFGVKSTFDEHFYTTKINKEDPNFERRFKEAEKIAKEIESQGASANHYLNEERGVMVDDSGMDEEDLYSGVDRRGNELLAALKHNSKQGTNQDSKNNVFPSKSQAHHVDPAIISSSTAGADQKQQQPKNDVDSARTKQQPGSANKVDANVTLNKENVSPVTPNKSPKRETSDSNSKKPNANAKEAQIEDLKKFSQKFRVPYEVPDDMKDILKKSALRGDPSLPPKPQSSSNRSSVPPTPSSGKIDVRKTSKVNSQEQTPVDSPSGRMPTSSRKRFTNSFFGSKVLLSNNNRREAFGRNFNMFLRSKEAYDDKQKQKNGESKVMEPFFIEKPYFTAPTWPGTVEQSYKTFFPGERTAVQRAQMNLQQRQMNSMNAAAAAAAANQQMGVVMGNMMRYPMGPGASPTPMLNGLAGNMGMYMPFQPQPMFYPSMPHMMSMMGGDEGGGSPSPQAVSPHMPPAYMSGAPGTPMAFGYPGAMPFQAPMMGGGGPSPRVGGTGNYRQNYHHHNSHGGHGHHRNNHDTHN